MFHFVIFLFTLFTDSLSMPKHSSVLFVVFALLFPSAVSAAERFEFSSIHMGTTVRIILYAPASDIAEKAAQEAFDSFQRLQGIMSDYDSDSELSLLCESRGCIRLSDELFAVLWAAKHYSTISEGAFDVTIGPLARLWRRSRRQQELPRKQFVEQAKQLVGNHLWEINENTQTVRLLKAGMRFDLGAIGKGYAIDRAFEIIQQHGISSLLVDAGGDFRVGSPPPGAEGWQIAKENETVLLKDTAMATSGGRFQFVLIDGVRYAHIVDPKTGFGITGQQTVYITAPTAMEADALATAVILLGREKGEALINTLPNVLMEFIEP